MTFKNPYWGTKTKIDLLSKWIIVHSIIYYELNNNIVTDQMFDDNACQLAGLISEDRQVFGQSKWFYVMQDFNGKTGFDIYKKLHNHDKVRLIQEAQYLIRQFGTA